MKTSMEKADFVLRLLTFLALVAGGLWAMYQYKLAGSDDCSLNEADYATLIRPMAAEMGGTRMRTRQIGA